MLFFFFFLLLSNSSSSKNTPTNDEKALLLLLDPANDLVGALRHHAPRDIGAGHAVEFKDGRDPRQAGGVAADAVQDFEVGVAGVDRGMELVVEGHEASAGYEACRVVVGFWGVGLVVVVTVVGFVVHIIVVIVVGNGFHLVA